jgi:hypothetical protein
MSSPVLARSPLEGALAGWCLEQRPVVPRLPVALLTRAQKAAELQRVQARRAMLAAHEAELVLGLAEDTPDSWDPPPGTPGGRSGGWAPDAELPGVSEFFLPELAMVLNSGRGTAAQLASRAWTYRESLPATWAALAAGELDEARAKVLVDVLEHARPAVARAIEALLLPQARGLSTGRLRRRALALLLERDAEAVNARRQAAHRQADVRCYPSHLEGMATLAADLPAPVAAACHELVDQLAQLLKADGDARPIGQLRAAVLADLLTRPWDDSRPAVTAQLSVTATLAALAGRSAEAGEVNGLPITAAHLRELLHQLGALGPGGLQAPQGGSLVLALTDAAGRLLATLSRTDLERLGRRGCPDHPDMDPDHPDMDDAAIDGGCFCAVLDRPPGTDRYQTTPAQRRWIKTRDRTCRFPNCGQRIGWADLDHVIPHAHGGPTDCANLCCLCRSHHRLKTHARGWRFTMTDDGTLTVTTPSGVTRTTRPPGLRAEPPRPAGPSQNPQPAPPPPPAPPEDDPPPF